MRPCRRRKTEITNWSFELRSIYEFALTPSSSLFLAVKTPFAAGAATGRRRVAPPAETAFPVPGFAPYRHPWRLPRSPRAPVVLPLDTPWTPSPFSTSVLHASPRRSTTVAVQAVLIQSRAKSLFSSSPSSPPRIELYSRVIAGRPPPAMAAGRPCAVELSPPPFPGSN